MIEPIPAPADRLSRRLARFRHGECRARHDRRPAALPPVREPRPRPTPGRRRRGRHRRLVRGRVRARRAPGHRLAGRSATTRPAAGPATGGAAPRLPRHRDDRACHGRRHGGVPHRSRLVGGRPLPASAAAPAGPRGGGRAARPGPPAHPARCLARHLQRAGLRLAVAGHALPDGPPIGTRPCRPPRPPAARPPPVPAPDDRRPPRDGRAALARRRAHGRCRRLGDPRPLSRVPARRSGPAPGPGRPPQRRGRPLAGPPPGPYGARARRPGRAVGRPTRRPGRPGPRLPPRAAVRRGPRLPRRGAGGRPDRGRSPHGDRADHHIRSDSAATGDRGAVVVATEARRLRRAAAAASGGGGTRSSRGVRPALGSTAGSPSIAPTCSVAWAGSTTPSRRGTPSACGPGRGAILAAIEGAKLREHRLADPTAAIASVERGLGLADRRRSLGMPEPALEADLRHRWHRLRTRLAARQAAAASRGTRRSGGRSTQARQDRRLAVGPDEVAARVVPPASRIDEHGRLGRAQIDGDRAARVEAAP